MERYKYPKTPHLPWSDGVSRDDKILKSVEHLRGKSVTISIKMDGENTTLYKDHMHARSIDSKDHESRHWVKSFHASIKHTIPEGWRVCGENLYAKHSIHYKNLPSYFMVFSVWNDKNICLSSDDTELFCDERFLSHVPVIYRGIGGEILKELPQVNFTVSNKNNEGYVVRLSDEFRFEDFDMSVAKYVRKNHVQTDKHWMYEKVIPNELR
jgi:hypothetical protein